jgi:hypothetical protein
MRPPRTERKLRGNEPRQPRSSIDRVLLKKGNAMIAAYIIKEYERAVVFNLGKVNDTARGPGLIFVVPFAQRIRRVSLRVVTMPIQSQGSSRRTTSASTCPRSPITAWTIRSGR